MQMKFSRALVWPAIVGVALAACTQDLNITNPNAPNTADFRHPSCARAAR